MNSSDIPGRTTKAFGVNGNKNTIPVDSSTTTLNNGQATMDSGFPPITMIALSAGGIPPGGRDFNGILYSVSLKQQWQDSGMAYPFNADFSTAISGYPKGARVPNSALTGFWLNTTDGNTSTPEVGSSTLTGWVPSGDYGITSIPGLSATSVTLTTLQAAKDRIVLSGALTANINVILPAWIKSWTVVNACTGNYSATIKTASGTGVTLPSGLTVNIFGDGINITQDSALLGYPGRLLSVQTFNSNGNYNRSPGARKIVVEVIGAGGGGGGAPAGSSTSNSVAGGGGAGSYAKVLIENPLSSYAVTIGSGGAGGITGQGGTGGLTSFGQIISCPGGAGGFTGIASNAGNAAGGGFGGDQPTISVGYILSVGGGFGAPGYMNNGQSGNGGNGANTLLGNGGWGNTNGAGSDGRGYGSGGGGALTTITNTTTRNGGNGAPGVVIVWEYS